MPAAPRPSALESELVRRLERFEQELREVHDLVTRMAADAGADAKEAKAMADALEKLGGRVTSLETTRSEVRGGLWAGRVLWLSLVAAAGVVGKLWH